MNEEYLIGIDEVGRGPLAGPICVCAIAVIQENRLKIFEKLKGIVDSKKVNEKKRERWFKQIDQLRKQGKVSYKVACVGAKIIDREGIQKTTKLAIQRVLYRLGIDPSACRIKLDGTLYAPKKFKSQETITKGDEKEWIISTASIIAKVKRDRKMYKLAKKYPQYFLDENKGYGTEKHISAIKQFGLSEEHRRSFCRNISK